MSFIIKEEDRDSLESLKYRRYCLERCDFLYSINELMNNPFFNLTIPILQKYLLLDEQKLVRIIGYTILLSEEYPENLYWLDDDVVLDRFFNIDYEWTSENRSLMKDFVALYFEYVHLNSDQFCGDFYEYETTVFDNIDIKRIDYVKLLPHDSQNLLFLLNLKMPSKLTRELVYDFVEVCEERLNYSYTELYNCLFCGYSQINGVFKDDKDINYRELANRVDDNPLAFCFLVAYIKANNLFEINNDHLFNYLHSHFIIAFRNFWWQCEVWGKYNEVINREVKERDFELIDSDVIDPWESTEKHFTYFSEYDRLFTIGTEFTFKFQEFCNFASLMGINTAISKDYLNPEGKQLIDANILEEPILNERFAALVEKRVNIEKSEEESGNGAANLFFSKANEDEAEKKQLMRSILNPDIDIENADEILSLLKEMTKGGKGKRVVTTLLGALKAGLLVRCPLYAELKKMGFEDIGVKQSFSNIHTQIFDDKTGTYMYYKYNEIDTYCSYFIEIKSKYLKQKQ